MHKVNASYQNKQVTILQPQQGILQRKCTCGNYTVASSSCSTCKKNNQMGLLQKAVRRSEATEIPPIVHDVLRSPGHPLDSGTLGFMASRFSHDFSQVRVHTDDKAAESANAVDALAYTAGKHIVFGARQYTPGTASGRELLVHELAHVMQQEQVTSNALPVRIGHPSGSEEVNADHLARSALSGERLPHRVIGAGAPLLSRRVIPRLVHCTAGTDGAPADPVTELTTIVDRAEGMATAASILLTLVAGLTRAGMRPVGSTVEQAFDDRFGEPPAVRDGFMNRLTGDVRPTLEIALSEEMELMARRYELIANQFGSGFIHYLCMSTSRSFGGCNITDCSNDAWACPGVNAIFLCPGFWGGDLRTSSTLLIHETSHMIWESVFHGARGAGGNFRHAECYASFVADIFGLAPGIPACPAT